MFFGIISCESNAAICNEFNRKHEQANCWTSATLDLPAWNSIRKIRIAARCPYCQARSNKPVRSRRIDWFSPNDIRRPIPGLACGPTFREFAIAHWWPCPMIHCTCADLSQSNWKDSNAVTSHFNKLLWRAFNYVPHWSKWHWCNGIAAKIIELLERHWRDYDATGPLPIRVRSTLGQPLTHDRCSPIKIDSAFARARHGNNSPNWWMPFARFRWVLLVLVRWTPICVDPISKNDKIPNCWPSKMRAHVDLDCAPGSLPILNWPHDARTRSICAPARSAADRDDNVSTHDIYVFNYKFEWNFCNIFCISRWWCRCTYLAHKYNV